jgi:CDP-4-dehydro-6-deoxyglucose reductase/ferredoxin-NAD(P)+ reductase (naphthalene dioxygenase ferredoxin-specific)
MDNLTARPEPPSQKDPTQENLTKIGLATPRRHAARVTAVEQATDVTRILRVSLEGGARLEFKAGQYAMLQIGDLPARAYSIASPPSAPALEFHVKNTGRGIGGHVFEKLKTGDQLFIEAPFGDHYWRPGAGALLALAGGVGIAPLKAIVETQLAAGGSAHLYWGARNRAHLYLDGFFRALAERQPKFRYTPVLSEETPPAGYRAGFIGPVLFTDFPSLAGHNIYMAGPGAMVEALLPQLLQHGADKKSLFSDSFGP